MVVPLTVGGFPQSDERHFLGESTPGMQRTNRSEIGGHWFPTATYILERLWRESGSRRRWFLCTRVLFCPPHLNMGPDK
jgi:hypothetical protein